ncbi:MAG TPA: signal peptidase I [Solirubrobacteraceae bacterium]|nr:signal peptidase I [Solirubrobacteraceae bacterium]
MKRIPLRSGLATLALLIVAGVAWFYFAPTTIGGSTRYVVTRGVSMEPRFHTGDLAIVRPESEYRVGEIVAYWSTALKTVVLHRIIAKDGNSYEFKGDNNHFIDPVRPTRSELLGKLWLHVPHGGRVLQMLHTPIAAALMCAVVALLAIFGVKESGRRRRRRRQGATGSGRPGIPIVNSPRDQRPFNFGALLTASALAAAVFLVLGLIAFPRPSSKPVPAGIPYSQQVEFGYSAHVRRGLVYPDGAVNTGDPIFLSLVHQVAISIGYGLSSNAPAEFTGTEKVLLQLTGPGGWKRTFVLTPSTRFTGARTGTEVTLDVPRLRSLLTKVGELTGGSNSMSYTISVVPRIHVKGTVAGHPVDSSFVPALSFQLSPTQLVATGVSRNASSAPAAGVAPAGPPKLNYSQTQTGAVATAPGSKATSVTVLGISPTITLLRWLASIGFLVSVAIALYAFLRKRSEPFEESFRIMAQYGHMIVPIVGGEDLGWPPVDVASIKALVRLAESGQRLILHNRADDVDTYMVNEEGTVYRYQVKPSKVVWGDWSDGDVTPVKAAA